MAVPRKCYKCADWRICLILDPEKCGRFTPKEAVANDRSLEGWSDIILNRKS